MLQYEHIILSELLDIMKWQILLIKRLSAITSLMEDKNFAFEYQKF